MPEMENNDKQVVQLLRNDYNNICDNREQAIDLVNKISNNLNKMDVKDGEPIIVRYRDGDSIITYMAVAAKTSDGSFVLSHVSNDIDANSVLRITNSSLTSTISAMSGNMYSMIEQTASSITATVVDKTIKSYSERYQTASEVRDTVKSALEGYTTRDQTAQMIQDTVGETLTSAKTYYKVSPTEPSIVSYDVDPETVGWSVNYPDADDIKEGDFIWLFTRYIYNSGERVVDTKISKQKTSSDAVTLYTWIAYASGSTGEGISNSPYDEKGNVLSYIGIAENMPTKKESYDDPSVYTWSLIKGEDGVNGKNGYVWIIYADKLDLTYTKNGETIKYPSQAYQQPKDSTEYIGIRNNMQTEVEDLSDLKLFKWSKFKGDDGVGTTYYTWVKYCDFNTYPSYQTNGSPKLSDTPNKGDGSFYNYMGLAFNRTEKESENPVSENFNEYTWSVYDATDFDAYKFVPLTSEANVTALDNLDVDISFNVIDIPNQIVYSAYTDVEKAGIYLAYKDTNNQTYTPLKDMKIVNEKYQTNVRDKSVNLIDSITVSMWKGNPDVKGYAQELAIDTLITSVGFKREAVESITKDAIIDSIQNENGDIHKIISNVSSTTDTIIDKVNGRVDSVVHDIEGLSAGTVTSDKIQTNRPPRARVEISGTTMDMFKEDETCPTIHFGIDGDGYPTLQFLSGCTVIFDMGIFGIRSLIGTRNEQYYVPKYFQYGYNVRYENSDQGNYSEFVRLGSLQEFTNKFKPYGIEDDIISFLNFYSTDNGSSFHNLFNSGTLYHAYNFSSGYKKSTISGTKYIIDTQNRGSESSTEMIENGNQNFDQKIVSAGTLVYEDTQAEITWQDSPEENNIIGDGWYVRALTKNMQSGRVKDLSRFVYKLTDDFVGSVNDPFSNYFSHYVGKSTTVYNWLRAAYGVADDGFSDSGVSIKMDRGTGNISLYYQGSLITTFVIDEYSASKTNPYLMVLVKIEKGYAYEYVLTLSNIDSGLGENIGDGLGVTESQLFYSYNANQGKKIYDDAELSGLMNNNDVIDYN